MDMEGLGEVVVNELVSKKLVKDITDIYGLSRSEILKLALFADKKADNLLKAIEKSKKQPLSKVLYGNAALTVDSHFLP